MEIYVSCPNCDSIILIYKDELNCSIFRHAVYKNTGFQINPHSSKEICDELIKKKMIYGCGKPFKVIYESNEYKSKICEYI